MRAAPILFGRSSCSAKPLRTPAGACALPVQQENPSPVAEVVCFLVGGPSQAPATTMAHDIAQGGALLTAVAAVDPYVPERKSRIRRLWRSVFVNISDKAVRSSARRAIDDFERQNANRRIGARRIVPGAEWHLLRGGTAHQLAVVPAWVTLDGAITDVANEFASVLARRTPAPVLRVACTPLDVRSVLFITDSTFPDTEAVRRYVRLGLWRDARILILPVRDARSSDSEAIDAQRAFLRLHGRNAAILPPLDLVTGMATLDSLVGQTRVAALAQFSRRSSLFSSIWNNVSRAVAERVPVVLLL
jgi:hypothetical protein